MNNFFNDIKYAFRMLRKNPGFTTVAILTLALCIGANIVIFAVVDAILIRSLPFPQADRLVIIKKIYPGLALTRIDCSLPNYYDWRKGISAFASTCAIRSSSVIIGEPGSPSRLLCGRVSPEFFATLQVRPAMGRFFTEEETEYGRSKVVVLTDSYWRSRCNADPGIIGKTIRVDGQVVTIVGVLPHDFRYLSSRSQLFFPLVSAADDRTPIRRHSGDTQIIARLSDGATIAAAVAQIRVLDEQQLKDDPYAAQLKTAKFYTSIFPLHYDHVCTVRPTLLLLQGGALFLLLIGGVNLINLLLIRASSRSRELAIRQSLGASHCDVAGQVMIETVLLTLIGGLFGLIVGSAGIRLLSVLGIEQLPLGAQVVLDGRVAAAALCGSLLVGVVLAVPIIWFNMHSRLALALQTESRGGTVSLAAQRLRQAFIVGQITLAFMLLVGAGLLTVSLQHVLSVSTGFEPQHVLSGQIALPKTRYPDGSSRLAFAERLLGELRAQPGITFAAISPSAPFTSRAVVNQSVVTVEGITDKPGDSLLAHYCTWLAGDYWQALGIPLRAGRLLEESDGHSDQLVCVVDEAFANRYWPNGDAIGRRLAKNAVFNDAEAFTIVGIVGNIKMSELVETPIGAVYFPYRYNSEYSNNVIIRTSLPPAALALVLQKTVQRLDPELPVDDICTMQARIDDSLIQRRSSALLVGIFASVALLLTAIGTYGVIAYAVTQRRHEIGVRMAMGALPQQIFTKFLAIGSKLLLTGLTLGLPGAWAVGRVMKSMLFGIGAIHIGVLAITAGTMILVVLPACLIPARRATRINPIEALRCE